MLVVVIVGMNVSAPARGEPVATSVEKIERRVGVMGTDLKIKLIGEDRGRLIAALDAAEAELRRVEDMMTDWRASPLTRLNAAAGRGPRVVPSELLEIIARGVAIGRLTGGAFDISYAALVGYGNSRRDRRGFRRGAKSKRAFRTLVRIAS